jgi:hypothetical protein
VNKKSSESLKYPDWIAILPRSLALSFAIASTICCLHVQAGPTQRWSQGTYIWDSHKLLEPEQRQQALEQLQNSGIQDLLIGLTGQQVKGGRKTEEAIRQLIRDAKARGQQVSLLLGDPNWIKPEGRHELIALIKRYQSLPLSGLHLDLEVEQLGWPVPAQRLNQWAHTLQEAKRVSPWPVSISSHPRWFEQTCRKPSTREQICVPNLLGDVNSVSLMMYQRNTERVTQRSLAIARRWPQIRFRLAQSVESQLSAEESWHGVSAKKLQRQVVHWQKVLGPAGINGVDWQDWAQYPKEN